MQRIFFYATPNDIVPALQVFESNAPLKFVQMGNLTHPNRTIYLSSSEIPRLGFSSRESGTGSDAYMVSYQETKNHMKTLIGRSGEKRWVLYNSDNEETTIMTSAGVWNDMIVQGLMDTMHTKNTVAQRLMRWFVSALRDTGFTKVDGAWVGQDAFELLRRGKRLSQAERSPSESDLKLS